MKELESSLRRDASSLPQSRRQEMLSGGWGGVAKSLQGTPKNQSPLSTPAKPMEHGHPAQKCALVNSAPSCFSPPAPPKLHSNREGAEEESLENQLNTPRFLNHRLSTYNLHNPKLEKKESPQLKIKWGVLIIIWDWILYLLI